ncbi:hypothetical protein KQH54_01350 [bacterium]|nr:hypothetical protein [bacterium]
MENTYPTPPNNTRIGFQYIPDTFHYRESDLITWLPRLVSMGAQWLVLDTPSERAIPEEFLQPLIAAGIEPILKMEISLANPPKPADLELLINLYASWGVHYITFFDHPNTLTAWSQETWVQQNLVSRFLDAFLPLAEMVCEVGMTPIFPALEPGGNFWDTAFLRSALQGIKTRGHTRLLQRMVIGAYAWPGNRTLNWGAGGPKAWPGVKPYYTPKDEQDHQGFRIFDWYTAISEEVLNTQIPIILLGTGDPVQVEADNQNVLTSPTETNGLIASLLAGEYEEHATREITHPIPPHILAGCFHTLASTDSTDPRAWYSLDGTPSSTAAYLQSWHASRKEALAKSVPVDAVTAEQEKPSNTKKPIKHYLLLPRFKWGIEMWYLEVAQPYIKKYAPTVGFSMREAFLAEMVTIVGEKNTFPEILTEELEKSGAKVYRITGSGTEIATKLTNI